MERTFVMLKPDAVQRGLMGEILSRIERKGYRVLAMRMETLSPEQAQEHYAEHVEKPFFPELSAYITSAPVVLMVVAGEQAVRGMRRMLGATDPHEAECGSIRGDLGFSKTTNLVHASDGPESARREIAMYFGADQICGA